MVDDVLKARFYELGNFSTVFCLFSNECVEAFQLVWVLKRVKCRGNKDSKLIF